MPTVPHLLAGLLRPNPYRQVSVAGAAPGTTELPHIQARVPGSRAPAQCQGPRAARSPPAAHSPRGCGRRARDRREAEDTPPPFMQIAGELQPIVTGWFLSAGAKGGGGRGAGAHGPGSQPRTSAGPGAAGAAGMRGWPLMTARRRHPAGHRRRAALSPPRRPEPRRTGGEPESEPRDEHSSRRLYPS